MHIGASVGPQLLLSKNVFYNSKIILLLYPIKYSADHTFTCTFKINKNQFCWKSVKTVACIMSCLVGASKANWNMSRAV